jgi:hypothetical protein
MEGSLVAYKVFTNGSVLQASEINDNLMRQAVMVFSNAAARSAAITVPLEGMLTWLEDVNRYENYNGTAWVTTIDTPGTVLVASNAFTTSASINLDNIFTSDYINYRIMINITGSSVGGQLTLNVRSSAPADITTGIVSQNIAAYGTTLVTVSSGSANIGYATAAGAASAFGFDLVAYNPNQTSSHKQISGTYSGVSSVAGGQYITGVANSNNTTTGTAVKGIRLAISAGTITGNIRVYGLKD